MSNYQIRCSFHEFRYCNKAFFLYHDVRNFFMLSKKNIKMNLNWDNKNMLIREAFVCFYWGFVDLFTCVGSGVRPSPDLAVWDTHLEQWMSESKNVEFRQVSGGYHGVQFRLVTVDWPDGSGDLLLILCSTVSS